MRVSVICPVFNTRPEELRAAADSVLGQQGGGVNELILVDDCSTAPGTLAMLDAFGREKGRIVVLRSASNAGPAAARNRGLDQASGDWVGFLDADDLWPADKVALASLALAQCPDSQWIIGDFANLGRDGPGDARPSAPCFDPSKPPGERQSSPALTRCIILDGLHLGACLIRRTRLQAHRFDPAVLYGEDLLFLAKLSLSTPANRAPGLSYLCRRQHESMMYSVSRLSPRFASGLRAGRQDRLLRGFRREYRWALYDVYKDLAVNNLANRRPWVGLQFAIRALCLDPREIRAMARFLALMPNRDRADVALRAKRYTKREVVLFNLDGTLDRVG